jgi:hypothetical protein
LRHRRTQKNTDKAQKNTETLMFALQKVIASGWGTVAVPATVNLSNADLARLIGGPAIALT